MIKRAALVAGLSAAAFLMFGPGKAPPSPGPAPVVSTPRPLATPLSSSSSAPALPENFDDGFCSPTGAESFELRFSIAKLVNEWIDQQQAEEPQVTALRTALRSRSNRLEAARQVAVAWPDFLMAQLWLAFEADEVGDSETRLVALRQARKLAPSEPAIGWALSEATRHSGELDEAIDGLSAVLQSEAIPEVSRLRARLIVARDIQRGYSKRTRNGVTVLWPSANLTTAQADQLAGTVDRALDDAAAMTGTTRRRTLTVVVYPSRSELLAVSCAREWAAALFDGTLRVVAAPTALGVEVKTLRHETLHGQLSPLAPSAPKWFQEGVAQAFSQEPPRTQTWTLMVRNRTWVPFASLDGTFQVFEGDADAELAYAQSYAMVELMRELGGDRSISIAREAFEAGANTSTALARACGRPITGDDLLAFLGRRLGR